MAGFSESKPQMLDIGSGNIQPAPVVNENGLKVPDEYFAWRRASEAPRPSRWNDHTSSKRPLFSDRNRVSIIRMFIRASSRPYGSGISPRTARENASNCNVY